MSNTPNAEILSMTDLISYQAGAIVSHQIIKSETGNVTLFAFDDGQELSEHTTPFEALVLVLDGEAEIRISGLSYVLKAGEAILMPANQPHAVKAVKQFKMLLTMIHG